MNKSTEELLKILKNSSLDAYLAENDDEMAENPICDYLTAVLNEKGLKKSEVIKNLMFRQTMRIRFFQA